MDNSYVVQLKSVLTLISMRLPLSKALEYFPLNPEVKSSRAKNYIIEKLRDKRANIVVSALDELKETLPTPPDLVAIVKNLLNHSNEWVQAVSAQLLAKNSIREGEDWIIAKLVADKQVRSTSTAIESLSCVGRNPYLAQQVLKVTEGAGKFEFEFTK